MEVKKSMWAERDWRPLSSNTHQHHTAILSKGEAHAIKQIASDRGKRDLSSCSFLTKTFNLTFRTFG